MGGHHDVADRGWLDFSVQGGNADSCCTDDRQPLFFVVNNMNIAQVDNLGESPMQLAPLSPARSSSLIDSAPAH